MTAAEEGNEEEGAQRFTAAAVQQHPDTRADNRGKQ